jgi:hypothetical protein
MMYTCINFYKNYGQHDTTHIISCFTTHEIYIIYIYTRKGRSEKPMMQ